MNEERDETQILTGLKSYWTERAHSYSAQNVAEMNDWRRYAWRDVILENAPRKEHLRVLDVGTGPGFFAMALALEGHTVTAVDVTEHMVQHARINASAYGADVSFILHRGEFLPFEDGSFDLIVSRNVLWNLQYPENALHEWARVLVPGGRMVYFDANWYRYLFDEQLRKEREEYRRKFAKKYPHVQSAGDLPPERVRDLEEMAYDLPLSKELRPQWDVRVLTDSGMKIIKVEEQIGAIVQNKAEFERDRLTPVFMVCAERM